MEMEQKYTQQCASILQDNSSSVQVRQHRKIKRASNVLPPPKNPDLRQDNLGANPPDRNDAILHVVP